MGDTRNIALIINASNFERQKVIVKAAHRILKDRGGYALYVFSNYGAFYENIYQHIRNGIILESDAREVVDVIRLIEAAWESSRTKSVQNL